MLGLYTRLLPGWGRRRGRFRSGARIRVGVVVPSATDRPLDAFPHLRRAPAHVLEGLRQVDPTSDLVYMGWGRWLLVSVRPNRQVIEHGYAILATARRLLELWRSNPMYRANPGAVRRLMGRYDFALLATLGARPIAEYSVIGEPTSAVVDDFRRRDWLFRHTSDDELYRQLEAPHEQRRAAAHADLTDPARARSGWRWMFTRSHLVTNPTRKHYRSGFTTMRVS